MSTFGMAFLIVGLLVATSEPLPHKYESTALPQSYYEIASEMRPHNYYSRTNYRSIRNGETPSHNSNSNWGHVQGAEIVTPSQVGGSIPSARSYSAGVLDQTLELQMEQTHLPHPTQLNPRDSHWTHEEQPNTTKTDQNASQYMDTSGGSKIIFPGQPEVYTVAKFSPEVSGQRPKCADEDDYCESADDYPLEYVRRIFQNEANSYVFGSDLMDVNLRINPDEEVSLCPSMEYVVYPRVAQNKDDKWLYIVNQDAYLQGIRVEKCAKQGSCTFAENFPNGYTTSCQQKYIYRKLMALNEDGRPVADSFRVPSCCSCVVTKSFRTRRMANDMGQSHILLRRRRRRR